MDAQRIIKYSKPGFFSCWPSRKLIFNIGVEVQSDCAVFSFTGPTDEVEKRFKEVLAAMDELRVKNPFSERIDHYQVDTDFAATYKGNSHYRFAIKLTSHDALLKLYDHLAAKKFNSGLNISTERNDKVALFNLVGPSTQVESEMLHLLKTSEDPVVVKHKPLDEPSKNIGHLAYTIGIDLEIKTALIKMFRLLISVISFNNKPESTFTLR